MNEIIRMKNGKMPSDYEDFRPLINSKVKKTVDLRINFNIPRANTPGLGVKDKPK